MAFLLMLVHQVIYVMQPFDWPSIAYVPAIPITVYILLAAVVFLLLEKKLKVISAQLILLAAFCPVIIASGFLNGWLGGGYIQLQLFTFSAIFPFVLYSNLLVPKFKQELVIFLFLIYAMIMLSDGLSQLSSPDGIGWSGAEIVQGTRIRFLGILNDPNDLGGFFLICLPFSLYFAWVKRNILFKIFGLGCAVGIIYGIYLTNSRGALLSSIFVSGVYFYLHYGAAKTAVLGVAASPLVVYIAAKFRAIELEASAEGRTDAWYEGLQMLESKPLFGVGMGNFLEEHNLVAHNSFVHVMAELGIIGYGIWFSIIVLSIYMPFHIMMKYRELVEQDSSISKRVELRQAVLLNNTIFYSIVGYMATTFFLSRSYTLFTFVICAFAVASYYRVVAIDQDFALVDINRKLKTLASYSVASIFFMYITTNIVAIIQA